MKREGPAVARYRAVAALSTCLLNVSVCWQKSGRPITSEETETGGFGARSLILGFPWVFGFWVSVGNLTCSTRAKYQRKPIEHHRETKSTRQNQLAFWIPRLFSSNFKMTMVRIGPGRFGFGFMVGVRARGFPR